MKENIPTTTDIPTHIVIGKDNYQPIVKSLKRIANKMNVDDDLVNDFIEQIVSGKKNIEIGNRNVMSSVCQKFKNFCIDKIRSNKLKNTLKKKPILDQSSVHAEFLASIIKDLEGLDKKIILSELLWLYACKATRENREEFKINISDNFNPELLKEFGTKAISYSEILAEIPFSANRIRKRKWNLYKELAKKYPNFEEILHDTNEDNAEYQDYDSNLRPYTFK